MTKRTLLAVVALALSIASPAAAQSELERTANLLGLEPGAAVAEIGAGDGEFAVALARRVGPDGRVYATEIESEKRAAIAAEASEQGLANVEVLEAQVAATGLPSACCRAVFMRHVYHHLRDPAAINRDLLRALEPGGRLLIVDFPPTWYLAPWTPDDVGEERSEHGIELDDARRELEDAGFELVEAIPRWDTGWLGPDSWALLVRRPNAAPAP